MEAELLERLLKSVFGGHGDNRDNEAGVDWGIERQKRRISDSKVLHSGRADETTSRC